MVATPVCSQCGAKLREIDFNGKWLQAALPAISGANSTAIFGCRCLPKPEALGGMVVDRALGRRSK